MLRPCRILSQSFDLSRGLCVRLTPKMGNALGYNLNCTHAPATTPSNAGIAGAGVLLSFMVTAAIALVISVSLVFQEFRRVQKPSAVRRKLLAGYSDQQIVTGIGIQSVGLAMASTLVPYHFFIIWMLSLLSMATHNASLLSLVADFRRDWVLRWMRQFLIFVNLMLSCIYGVFILQAVLKRIENSTLPIACAWNNDLPASVQGSSSTTGLSVAGTIVVVAGNAVVFAFATWYLHTRMKKCKRATQMVGLAVMAIIAVGATIRVIIISQAFGNPPIQLSDQGEKQWSFGTLITLLVMILPLISAIEILRGRLPAPEFTCPIVVANMLTQRTGEIDVPPPVFDDDVPLLPIVKPIVSVAAFCI